MFKFVETLFKDHHVKKIGDFASLILFTVTLHKQKQINKNFKLK